MATTVKQEVEKLNEPLKQINDFVREYPGSLKFITDEEGLFVVEIDIDKIEDKILQ